MGIFFESDSERATRENNEGQHDGSRANNLDRFAHNVSGGRSDAYNAGWKHGLDNPAPKPKSKKEASPSPYRSKTKSKSPKNDSSGGSRHYSSVDSSSSSGVAGCIGLLLIIGLGVFIHYLPMDSPWTKGNQVDQTVWTMREVSAPNLNIRSAPGVNSPLVATLPRLSRLAVTGEPVKNGKDLWIRVSTDDGSIQGWANQKYINFGPNPLGHQTETPATQESSADPVATTPTATRNSTSETSPAPLLVPVPYDQPQPQASPSQSQSPNDRSVPPVNRPRIRLHSPNVRLANEDVRESAPKNQQSEQTADGTPRLKRRAPQ